MALTVKGIASAEVATEDFPDAKMRWISDGGSHGIGQLYVRIAPSSRTFYFRYKTTAGERVAEPLGEFTKDETAGMYTLKQARAKANELCGRLKDDPDRDLRAQDRRAAEDRAAKQLKDQREADDLRRATNAAALYTVAKLGSAYADHLEKLGKISAKEVRGIFAKHLDDSDVGAIPAHSLTPKAVTGLFRKIKEEGKGRTAAKLRSYLRAAYALAAKAELDASIPTAFLDFGVELNPIAPTASMSGESKPRENTLDQTELLKYTKRIAAIEPAVVRDALRLQLVLGCQRTAQLLRLKLSDVDLPGRSLRLYDPKGRRTQPRVHDLPLTDAAVSIIEPLIAQAQAAQCEWVFSADGKEPLKGPTLSAAAHDVLHAMLADKEARRAFTHSDVRRTCETLLAGMQVSREVRAQLQSHGLSGVQARHYDRHSYSEEKLVVLKAWADLLAGKYKGNVVSIRRKAARG